MNLEFLEKLLKIRSVTFDKAQINNCCKFIASFLENLGFYIEIFKEAENPCIFAQFPKEKKKYSILFYNHYDVMPADEKDWLSCPFLPTIKDKKIFARGSCDNKGNLAARILAAEAFIKKTKNLDFNIKFLIEGEEETGSIGLEKIIKKHKKKISADLCIWENGWIFDKSACIYLGCKGIIFGELEITTSRTQGVLHSSLGLLYKNPAIGGLKILSCLLGRLKVLGLYNDIQQPTNQEIELVCNFPFEEFYQKKLSKREKIKHIFSPLFNINTIKSGYLGQGHKTIIPQDFVVKFDIRLVPNQNPQKIKDNLIKFLSFYKNVELKKFSAYPAFKSDINHPLIKKTISFLKDKVKNIYILPMIPASGPMYLFESLPILGIGISSPLSNPHGANEFIEIDSLYFGIELFFDFFNFIKDTSFFRLQPQKAKHHK